MKSFKEQLVDFLNYYRDNPSKLPTETIVDTYLNVMKNTKEEPKYLMKEEMLLNIVIRKFTIKELKEAFIAGKTEDDFVKWFDKFNRNSEEYQD